MHNSTSSSIPQPPASSLPSTAHLNQSILKRKRNTSELSSHSSSSWFGLAFQFPSVIKKEFNDFVKTIKGGYSQAMEGNFIDLSSHEPHPQHLLSSTSTSIPSKLKKSQPNRNELNKSHRSQTNPIDRHSHFKKPLSTFPFQRSSNRKHHHQTNHSNIIDQPTPPKKLRLSNSTTQTDHPSIQSSHPTRLSVSSGPTSPRLLSINAQLGCYPSFTWSHDVTSAFMRSRFIQESRHTRCFNAMDVP
ncbi:hypothetical protein DFH28DRAFT_1122313 [Melampsora americana]|nr:hypothetical protein DFH28DRAFT_1122313 [Melampsora americana]